MSVKFFQSARAIVLTLGIWSWMLSCKPSDDQIDKAVSGIVAAVAPGVEVSVQNGVVVLRGTMPDEATRSSLDSALRKLRGVVSLTDNTTVPVSAGPVVTNTDAVIRNAIDAGLRANSIQGVAVKVQDSVVTLTGTVNAKEMNIVRQLVDQARPKKVLNGLTVK